MHVAACDTFWLQQRHKVTRLRVGRSFRVCPSPPTLVRASNTPHHQELHHAKRGSVRNTQQTQKVRAQHGQGGPCVANRWRSIGPFGFTGLQSCHFDRVPARLASTDLEACVDSCWVLIVGASVVCGDAIAKEEPVDDDDVERGGEQRSVACSC